MSSKFKELVPEFIYSVINGLIYQNCIVGLFTAVQVIITAYHANFDVLFKLKRGKRKGVHRDRGKIKKKTRADRVVAADRRELAPFSTDDSLA